MGNTCSGDEAVPSPESWSGFTIPYQVQTSGYRVWLFGDSILDNSYWNGVEAQTTGEWLKRMLPDIEVRDRSTEELDAMSLLNCLQQGKAIGVRDHYVRHRKEIGVPYEDNPPSSGAVDPNPEFGAKDFVILCVGGNDFALRGEMDPTAILDLVQQAIQFYKGRGINPARMFYLTPYPPTSLMKVAVRLTCRGNLSALYEQCVCEAKQMCENQGIKCIPLDHFGDEERIGPGTGIPEPTPKGAKELALLIQEAVLSRIQVEEGAGGDQ